MKSANEGNPVSRDDDDDDKVSAPLRHTFPGSVVRIAGCVPLGLLRTVESLAPGRCVPREAQLRGNQRHQVACWAAVRPCRAELES